MQYVRLINLPKTIRLLEKVGILLHEDEFGFVIVRVRCEQKLWNFTWSEVQEIRIPKTCVVPLKSDYFDFTPCGHCTACLQQRDCLRPQ